jgi:hypothetical protein
MDPSKLNDDFSTNNFFKIFQNARIWNSGIDSTPVRLPYDALVQDQDRRNFPSLIHVQQQNLVRCEFL